MGNYGFNVSYDSYVYTNITWSYNETEGTGGSAVMDIVTNNEFVPFGNDREPYKGILGRVEHFLTG